MSALAMILTVAMVVPADGLGKVPGEMVQGLDLSGEWEGVWLFEGASIEVILRDGKLQPTSVACGFCNPNRRIEFPFNAIDDGRGNLRINSRIRGKSRFLGIYRGKKGEEVVIRFREAEKGRPTEFRADKDQYRLILHRVKSRK